LRNAIGGLLLDGLLTLGAPELNAVLGRPRLGLFGGAGLAGAIEIDRLCHLATPRTLKPFSRPAYSLGDEPMIQPSEIREHMEVLGSDGGHVGRVDHVVGDEIELAKFDMGAGLKHHMIPITWIEMIEDEKVRLNLTQDAAKASWREKH
jgi:hypothetical protein